MARQYSPTQFFRRVPNALLARYFQEKHGVLQEIDFGKLKENDADTIFQAFTALPDERTSGLVSLSRSGMQAARSPAVHRPCGHLRLPALLSAGLCLSAGNRR